MVARVEIVRLVVKEAGTAGALAFSIASALGHDVYQLGEAPVPPLPEGAMHSRQTRDLWRGRGVHRPQANCTLLRDCRALV